MFKWILLRLLILFVVLAAVDVACQSAPGLLHLPWLLPNTGAFAMTRGIGLALAMILAYRLLVRWTERRKADELGPRGAVSLTLLGIVLGGAMFALAFALLAYKGIAHLGSFLGTNGVWVAVGGAIADAVGEEIVIRGVVFRLLEESFGTLVGLFVSGALFGLLHSFNHGASLVSTAAIALEAGVFLAAGYAATRSLWFPIGLHFGWNFTEGGVFGAAVSGGAHQGLLAGTFTGDALWSGGAFGPEASVVAVGVSLLASAILLAVAIVRGNWVGVRFRMKSA
jgi:membrane protease YdiL (CAAX protease family)